MNSSAITFSFSTYQVSRKFHKVRDNEGEDDIIAFVVESLDKDMNS